MGNINKKFKNRGVLGKKLSTSTWMRRSRGELPGCETNLCIIKYAFGIESFSFGQLTYALILVAGIIYLILSDEDATWGGACTSNITEDSKCIGMYI